MNTSSRKAYECLIEAVKAFPQIPTSVVNLSDESFLADADSAGIGGGGVSPPGAARETVG